MPFNLFPYSFGKSTTRWRPRKIIKIKFKNKNSGRIFFSHWSIITVSKSNHYSHNNSHISSSQRATFFYISPLFVFGWSSHTNHSISIPQFPLLFELPSWKWAIWKHGYWRPNPLSEIYKEKCDIFVMKLIIYFIREEKKHGSNFIPVIKEKQRTMLKKEINKKN